MRASFSEIGGGKSFSGPPSYDVTRIIDGAATIRLSNTCGKFDIEDDLRQFFRGLSSGLDRAVNALLFAAQDQVISNLLLYILRRADPNLADMLENAMLRYEEYVAIAIKSCQDAQEEILNGDNPFYDYVKIGRKARWDEVAERAIMGEENATATNAEFWVQDRPGCVTWIDGEERLCDNNPDIPLVEDVLSVGYDSLTRSRPGTTFGASDSRLRVVWPNMDSAKDWVTRAFGEVSLRDVYSVEPGSQMGVGVMPALFEEARTISNRLGVLSDASVLEITPADEELLSVPGLTVTEGLIEAIQEIESPELKEQTIERIATEFSLLKQMEKITLSRRLLTAGLMDPNIISAPFAGKIIREQILPSMDTEYQHLQDEYLLRKRVADSTALQLVKFNVESGRQNRGTPGGSPSTPVLQDGGLLQEGAQ